MKIRKSDKPTIKEKTVPSRWIVQRLKSAVEWPDEKVFFMYIVRRKYGTKSRKKYGKSHGKPVGMFTFDVIAKNLCRALNDGTVSEYAPTSKAQLARDAAEEAEMAKEDAAFEAEMGLKDGSPIVPDGPAN